MKGGKLVQFLYAAADTDSWLETKPIVPNTLRNTESLSQHMCQNIGAQPYISSSKIIIYMLQTLYRTQLYWKELAEGEIAFRSPMIWSE